MMDYKKSYMVLEVMYESCIEFWLGEGKDDMNAYKLAMKDVEGMEHNPFSPNGEALNPEAKADFIKKNA